MSKVAHTNNYLQYSFLWFLTPHTCISYLHHTTTITDTITINNLIVSTALLQCNDFIPIIHL